MFCLCRHVGFKHLSDAETPEEAEIVRDDEKEFLSLWDMLDEVRFFLQCTSVKVEEKDFTNISKLENLVSRAGTASLKQRVITDFFNKE